MPALLEPILVPFVDPASRTFWPGLVVSALIAGVFFAVRRPTTWTWQRALAVLRHPSTHLDVQLYLGRALLQPLLGLPTLAGAWLLATHAVRRLDAVIGVPDPPALPPLLVSVLFSAALFIAWDGSRWGVHWLMHRVPALWAFHQIHHSAEILTPLTFHRLHPLESVLYQLRGLLVTGGVTALFFWLYREAAVDLTLLGVSALGLVLNLATGNLRHSHLWLRFPDAVERWLLSPAQHQLHHSAAPEHLQCPSLSHIRRSRRSSLCRARWSPAR